MQESEQDSDDEGGHLTEGKLPTDDEREEEPILNPEPQGLGFRAMLRSAVPSKKNLKKAGNRETELWHTMIADAQQLNDIPGPDSAVAVIKINALQAVYGKDTFKPPALAYCFSTKVKQEDIALVQIQEKEGLLGAEITLTMVVLASV